MSQLAARRSAPAIEASLAALCRDAGRLSDAAAYVLSGPGKRLRARILLHWVDRDEPELVDAAAAIELLHEGSLCHDDVCDFGLSRRGRPSVAARFGVRCAGLTGALFVGRGIERLARACLARGIDTGLESLDELSLGQLLEGAAPGSQAPRERYRDVVQKKTGTLFRYPAELGARWRGEDPERARAFAQAFALAFQAMDDLADLDSRDAASWPVIDWIETSGDRGAALGRWTRGEVSPAEILASGAGERTRELVAFQLARARACVEHRPAVIELLRDLAAPLPAAVPVETPVPLPPATSRTFPAVRAHEDAIAAGHPDSSAAAALRETARLIEVATQLFRQLPAAPLAELPRDAPLAQPVMVGDHLLATAVRTLTPLGASALAHFGEMVSRSALAEADGPGDPSGVSRLLAQIVAEARGVPPEPFVAAREDEALRLSRA